MIAKTLLHLVPGAEFVVTGEPSNADEYTNQVQWLDTKTQPTWAELIAAIPNLHAEEARKAVEDARRLAYNLEADPLFFGWQRGENTEQEWLDKVAEIRARHPYS